MSLLSVAILFFILLETSNIIMLYFFPQTKMGNGVGVFNAYEKSKADPDVHNLIRYLVNWVAGTKLIFIALLIIILIKGDMTTKALSVGALILSILTFYWRLYPAIKSMDQKNQITPRGYSKTLAFMIAGFIIIFLAGLIFYFLNKV